MKKIIHGVNLIVLALFIIHSTGCKKDFILSKDDPKVPPADTTQSKPTGPVIEKASYYIAPNGDDTNPGTIDKPFKTWDKILNLVEPGMLVYVRGGVYFPKSTNQNGARLKGKNGTAEKYIRFWAYPGEHPVLDCSPMKLILSLSGVEFAGDYWHFKGLEVKNLPQPVNDKGIGLFCVGFSANNCNHNIFENLNVHHNGCMGFSLGGNATDNLILNCDSHHNYDPTSVDSQGKLYDGGHADGFRISLNNGEAINTLKGCRSWSNSDDGYDCWGTEGIINFENCQAFWNGYKPGTTIIKGDGNGFKFGATYLPADGKYHRVVTNCIAFQNSGMGFDQNNATCQILLENNTTYRNCQFGFYFDFGNAKNKLKNNIAVENSLSRSNKINQVGLASNTDNTNNSWNGIGGDGSQFITTDTKGVDAERKPDGTLQDCNYLKLKKGSIYIDKGMDVGLPYNSLKPDLGAFESN
jgi:hypothetical protein